MHIICRRPGRIITGSPAGVDSGAQTGRVSRFLSQCGLRLERQAESREPKAKMRFVQWQGEGKSRKRGSTVLCKPLPFFLLDFFAGMSRQKTLPRGAPLPWPESCRSV